MPPATERIVLQITSADKIEIRAKAKRLGLSTSELMRRSSLSYFERAGDANIGDLADRTKASANSCATAIDDALHFIAASNMRIAGMERRALNKTANHSASHLQPLHTESDYKAALERVSTLVDADPKLATPEANELKALGALVQAYEARNFPLDLPDPFLKSK